MFKKSYQISIVTLLCILINFGGKCLTEIYSVPCWLDSFGTVIAAYLMGPICGAIVGATVNIVYGLLQSPMALLYLLTNISVGIVVGLLARLGVMENILKTLSTASCTAIVSALVSAPINVLFYEGTIGNVWGDGIFALLTGWNVPVALASFIAEFYLEFLDKFITLLALYILIHLYRAYKGRNGKTAVKALQCLLFFGFTVAAAALFSYGATDRVYAAENENVQGYIAYEDYNQKVYNSESGLLSGEANDIAATDDGVLWIGTYAGLYRYTGTDFTYMSDYETVKNVNCLYVDQEGRLWVGTNDDGVSICINNRIANNLNVEKGLPSDSVRSIVQQSGGNYFIGTSDSLAIVKLSGGIKIINTIPEITYAQDLTADKKNHVAACTAAGKIYLFEGEEIVAELTAEDGDMYSSCMFDESGLLWLGTTGGQVYRYALGGISHGVLNLWKRAELDASSVGKINSISRNDARHVFVLGDDGIAYISNDSVNKLNTGSFSSSVYNMAEDYQGNLWFSSSRLGIMKMCASPFSEVYQKAGLDEVVVNSITGWQNSLYIGTDHGLDVIDAKTGFPDKGEPALKLKELLNGHRIRSLFADSSDRLWICSYGTGLLRVSADGEIRKWTAADGVLGSFFRTCTELGDGSFAVSSELGITFIDGETGEVTAVLGSDNGLENPLVLCMLSGSVGTAHAEGSDADMLYAGTDGAGIAIIQDKKIIKRLKRADGLGSGVILRIVREKSSSPETEGLFIVTSNGICYMDADENITALKAFPYSNNYDLYDDGKGSLFVTGSAGIYVVNKKQLLGASGISSAGSALSPEQDGEIEFRLLNQLNGLSDSFTANAWNYIDRKNNWFIAGSKGVTCMNLDRYRDRKNSYRMLLEAIQVDETMHSFDDDNVVQIPAASSYVELTPEIINYSTDDPYVRYYMEGVDAEPMILRRSELKNVHYTDLPSGKNAFHLAIIDSRDSKKGIIEEQVYTIIRETELQDKLWFRIYFFGELFFIVIWATWFITRIITQRTIEIQRRELARTKEQLRMGNETIIAIARAVDAKDTNTSHHSERVSQYSELIARRMGYSENDLENLRRAALLHDIGKIGIPDAILKKPERLTDEEFSIMRSHVTKGAEILKDFTLIPHVIEGTLYHHERYDGSGYASGLKGEEIPEYARIIGIADAFDAMTSNRVYRKHLDMDRVMSELRNNRGKQFDPVILDHFLALMEEGRIDSILKGNVHRQEEGDNVVGAEVDK